MSKAAALLVETHCTLAAVEALEAEWRTLDGASPDATGFQSFEWCVAWLRCSGIEPRVVTVRDEGRLAMLWPLQIERCWGARIARWIGEPLTQYGDALAAPGADVMRCAAAVETSVASWRDADLVALSRLRADGALAALAHSAAGEEMRAPFVDLAAPPAPRRKSLERRARKLEAFGPVALEEADSPAGREAAALRALAMKQAWLDAHGFVSTGLSAATTPAFVAAAARAGVLRVHCLRVGGEIAAAEMGLAAGGGYRSLLGAFDPRFSEGAPGHALTRAMLAKCAREGMRTYDFLPPGDDYKEVFATGAVSVGARYWPLTLRGRIAAFGFERLRPVAKRLYYALAARGLFTRGRQPERKASAAPGRASHPLLGS